MNRNLTYIFCIGLLLQSCIFVFDDKKIKGNLTTTDSLAARAVDSAAHIDALKDRIDSLHTTIDSIKKDSTTTLKEYFSGVTVNTKNVAPVQVVEFAKTLIGIPYRYGSTDPKVGFDCSGFITHVFNHFEIIVPRSSIDFTGVGKEVSAEGAKPGDLILFTGTDSTEKFVGHMGLIVSNDKGVLNFIHSTSGKKYGVTITEFNGYYKSRYMKTIRIFPQNG
jgi:cell wall-associated NlpC family hydrolase